MKDVVMGQGSPKELVKAHENIELVNRPRMPKEKEMGQRSPQAL